MKRLLQSKEPHARQWILEQPYLRVPRNMPISVLPKYLSPRLGVPGTALEMRHKGASLPPARTVVRPSFYPCRYCFFSSASVPA